MRTKNVTLLNNIDLINLQRRLLQLVIIFYPFNFTPLKLPLVGGSLPLFFLLIGYFLFIIELFIRPISFSKYEKIGIFFLLISFLWYLITVVIGVNYYQYYHLIDVSQDDKLQILVYKMNQWGYENTLLTTKIWLLFLGVRSAILETLFAYSITFWVFHIYKENFKKAFCDIYGALKILCLFISIYSLIEVGYLLGNELCKDILVNVNPIFLKVAYLNDWWPPLLWPNLQARSLFAEPSFFGIFLAMVLPFFVQLFLTESNGEKKNNYIFWGVYIFLIMLLVMSKARTAIALVSGEILLIILWQLCIHRKEWKKFFYFFGITIVAISLGLFGTFNFQSIDTKVSAENNTNIQSYATQNVTSIVGNQRSNNARLANTLATSKVGLENPLFGVGPGLVHEYIVEQLTVEDLNNPEVNKWTTDLKEQGPLRAGYPILNHLSWIFAAQGAIGLVIFLLPTVYIIKSVFLSKQMLNDIQIFSVFVAFSGLVVAFLSNAAQLGYYILCGLLICYIRGKSSR